LAGVEKVFLTLRNFPNRQYWDDGRQMPVCDLRTGQVNDLRRDPVALLDKPYHDLFSYLPRSALDAIADDADAVTADPAIVVIEHDILQGMNGLVVRSKTYKSRLSAPAGKGPPFERITNKQIVAEREGLSAAGSGKPRNPMK